MKKVLCLPLLLLALNFQTEAEAAESPIEVKELQPTEVKKIRKNNLSENEVELLFTEYIVENELNSAEVAELNINNFVDYTVETGAIYDTPQAKASVAVKAVRLQFEIVVVGGRAIGLSTSAELLDHSLQDSPAAKTYASGTAISNQVKNSSEVKDLVASIRTKVSGQKLSSTGTSGSLTLNSTKDLYLSINKVSYQAKSTKNASTGLWTTTITFSDEYDFDPIAWKSVSGLSSAAVAALTNYAVDAERIGAIVPYDVKIVTVSTFYEK